MFKSNKGNFMCVRVRVRACVWVVKKMRRHGHGLAVAKRESCGNYNLKKKKKGKK